MAIANKLIELQLTLKAPKGQFNTFGGYKYRSCEDILEAVKPLLKDKDLFLTLSDDVQAVGTYAFVKATATLSDGKESITTTACARDSIDRKGMDASQITGAASSYARKYALNGMFCIDDTKDADSTIQHNEEKSDVAMNAIKKATTMDELKAVWTGVCKSDSRYSAAINARKVEL